MNDTELATKIDKISETRYSAMEAADMLLEELINSGESYPDYAWSAIGMELYHCGRLDTAIKAMLLAIEEGEKLEGTERGNLIPLYADLSMMYEEEKDYQEAFKYMKKALELRKEINTNNPIFVKLMEEDVRRLEHLANFKANIELKKEFEDYMDELKKD